MASPRLYRFYNYEQKQYAPAPVGGWNPDAPVPLLAETQAPVLDNFLIRPGKIVCRGQFTVWADLTANAPLNICGIHPHLGDQNIIIGRKVASATAYIDPWNAPIIRPPAAASIAAPSTTVLIAQGGTTITSSVQTAAKVPGPRGITFEGLRYYIGYGTSSAPVADAGGTYFAQSTSLCTQSGASTFTELVNAPHGAVDLKGYQSRIWLLAGIDTPGAGTTFSPTALFFTNPIANGGGTASADWKDPVTGLTNKIVMDGDFLDPSIGLATARNALVVFRYASVWALRGSTTATYALSPISREAGCIDARSIVECDKGVYFLSTKGLMLTDGASVRNVTGMSVQQTLQNAIGVYLAGILGSFGGYATCARASDGQIIVSIGVAGTTAGAPDGHIQPVWCGLYNPDNGTWVRLTSPIWALDGTIITPGNSYPGWSTNPADKRLVTVGDKYITQLEAPASASTVTTSASALPTVAVDDASVGTQAWTNVTNVEANDGNPAASALDSVVTTHFAKTTGYGFAVPVSATITGIQLAVKKASTRGAANNVKDSSVRLLKAGVATGTDKADTVSQWNPSGYATVVYGGSSDLWGTTWSPADVNNANFGASLSALINGSLFNVTAAQVDYMQLTVYYTVGIGTGPASFVQNAALYDKMADGTFQAIPAMWKTHLSPLVASAHRASQAKRFFLDYVFQGNGILAANGWNVAATDETGSAYATAQLPLTAGSQAGSVSGGSQVATAAVQRFNQDMVNEMKDLQFAVSWTDSVRGSAPSNIVPELYGVGIEFQPTRDTVTGG